ncbi:syntaphilin-like isoform X1 [Oncorhynchus keta]|uniref:syntaphilin-like isoform X1 n=1 Tax=Oncorhynchus keta TaxID=8018 RepID=UPI0015FD729B|nr:syntaphilin-like isoform X1 [Oncorhynchus keta]XP_035596681.1 syntaphilin-like isoform X1 [Oncorhynchus keta]XP_035596682.1 syntaphilin-like isoform X1 [Oncorhynchus keta]XP_035596683.1 syntaphilin-like isoform X1 [Oncorhynchus keta]
MSAPAPSTRRSVSGSRRFDYCRFIELDYIPMETDYMVSMRPTERGYLTTKSPERHCRRTAAPVSNRDPYGNASLSSSSTNSGSCKGSECSPTKGRHMKAYASCTDNHGIRPPPPEQYLTPLQQKEVCIRHLRARLKESVDRLQDRDSEIDSLKTQLCRMQEDWVEEECHRVEAQLALKEAHREIQQLKEVVDVVRTNLSSSDSTDTGVQKYFQDINAQNLKLENLLLSMELAQNGVAKEQEAAAARGVAGGSRAGRPGTAGSWPGSSPAASGTGGGGSKSLCGSCDGSPARSLTHSSTYTKLSDHALGDKNGNGLSGEENHDSGFVCCGESHSAASSQRADSSHRADLLLEAAFLSEETASLLSTYSHLPQSSTYEKLCTGQDRVVPLRCAMGGAGSTNHSCLSHHHLYLHHLREQAVQTESCPVPVGLGYASDLDTITERTFRSQACSPTSTWVSDEGDDLDSVTMTSVTMTTLTATTAEPAPGTPLPSSASVSCAVDMASLSVKEDGKMVGELERHIEVVGEGAVGMVEVGKQQEEEDVGLVQLCKQEEVKVLGLVREGKQGEVRELDLYNQREEVLEVKNQRAVEEVRSVEVEERPHTSQPRSSSLQEIAGVTVVEVDDDEEAEVQGAVGGAEESTSSESGPAVKTYWSRHFLVDLLAVAVPVVPTVAWLCQGARRDGLPIYHFGSLLRGCCTVALSSLRRGGGVRHYPAGTGGGAMGGTEI